MVEHVKLLVPGSRNCDPWARAIQYVAHQRWPSKQGLGVSSGISSSAMPRRASHDGMRAHRAPLAVRSVLSASASAASHCVGLAFVRSPPPPDHQNYIETQLSFRHI